MKWLSFLGRSPEAPVARAPARKAEAVAQTPFHAVEVVSSGQRCEAARAVENVRFLSRGGPPPLPLPGCTRCATCTCRYRHHEDRRNDARRVADHVWGAQGLWPSERERRRTRGRRATDGPSR